MALSAGRLRRVCFVEEAAVILDQLDAEAAMLAQVQRELRSQ